MIKTCFFKIVQNVFDKFVVLAIKIYYKHICNEQNESSVDVKARLSVIWSWNLNIKGHFKIQLEPMTDFLWTISFL